MATSRSLVALLAMAPLLLARSAGAQEVHVHAAGPVATWHYEPRSGAVDASEVAAHIAGQVLGGVVVGAIHQHHRHHHSLVLGWTPAPVYVPPVYVPAPVYVPVPVPVPVAAPPPPPPPPPAAAPAPAPAAAAEVSKGAQGQLVLGVTAQGHPSSASLGASLRAEGKKVGVSLGAGGFFSLGEDEEVRVGTLRVFDARLAYAPLSGERGRLRLELGASAAMTPGSTTIGPDAGASAELRLIGPFGVSGSAYLTPFPHRRVDAAAAATLALGGLRLEAGWRSLWLLAPETACFRGPYVGAALVF